MPVDGGVVNGATGHVGSAMSYKDALLKRMAREAVKSYKEALMQSGRTVRSPTDMLTAAMITDLASFLSTSFTSGRARRDLSHQPTRHRRDEIKAVAVKKLQRLGNIAREARDVKSFKDALLSGL